MTIRISGIDQTSGQETIVNGDSGKLLIGPSTGTAHYALTVWGTGNSIIRTGCWANDAGTTSGSQFYAVRDGTAGVAITCLSASFTTSGINLADSASLSTDNAITNGLIIGAGSSTARPTRFNVGGNFVAAFTTTPTLNLVSGLAFGWSSNASDPTVAADTQLKRDAAGFTGFYGAGSTYGGVRIGDGLSGTPSIAFGSETTLGLYKSAASTMALVASNFFLNGSRLTQIAAPSSNGTALATVSLADSTAGSGVGLGTGVNLSVSNGTVNAAFANIRSYKEVAGTGAGNFLASFVLSLQNGDNLGMYEAWAIDSNGSDRHISGAAIGWTSSATDPKITTALDTQLKRDAAGIVGVYGSGSTYGSLRIADGLSSSPSIAYGSETTMGLFKSNPGFQTLASTVDGNAGAVVRNYGNSGTTTRCGFSVYSDGGGSPGNLSINTLSPGWTTSGLLTPSTAAISTDTNTTGGLTLYTLASAPITLGTNGASRWTINSSGRLSVSTGGSWSAASPEILGPTDGSLFISAADSGSGGNDAYFSGAVGSGAGNAGGAAFIQGGTPTDGQGGAVTIRGAAGVGTSRAGGAVTINGGTGGSTNGLGGAITIRSGTGDGTGAGGALSIQSGSSGSSAGSSGGNLSIFSGGASGPFSNMPAGNVTIYAGIGTGSSTNKLLFQTGYQLGSSSSPQSNYDRQLFPNNTKALSTTTATPTEFVRMALTTTDSAGGCVVDGTIAVADGSHNVGCIAFTMIVSAVNQNGTVTAECSTFTDESTGSVITGGTFTGLTVVYSVSITGTSVQLLVAPAWSAGTPTSVVLSYQVRGNGRVTFTPQ